MSQETPSFLQTEFVSTKGRQLEYGDVIDLVGEQFTVWMDERGKPTLVDGEGLAFDMDVMFDMVGIYYNKGVTLIQRYEDSL